MTDETDGAKVLPTCVPFPLPECHWCKYICIDVTYWTINDAMAVLNTNR
jgi:hypothetical protein